MKRHCWPDLALRRRIRLRAEAHDQMRHIIDQINRGNARIEQFLRSEQAAGNVVSVAMKPS
jgi:hypothetical protein